MLTHAEITRERIFVIFYRYFKCRASLKQSHDKQSIDSLAFVNHIIINYASEKLIRVLIHRKEIRYHRNGKKCLMTHSIFILRQIWPLSLLSRNNAYFYQRRLTLILIQLTLHLFLILRTKKLNRDLNYY